MLCSVACFCSVFVSLFILFWFFFINVGVQHFFSYMSRRWYRKLGKMSLLCTPFIDPLEPTLKSSLCGFCEIIWHTIKMKFNESEIFFSKHEKKGTRLLHFNFVFYFAIVIAQINHLTCDRMLKLVWLGPQRTGQSRCEIVFFFKVQT